MMTSASFSAVRMLVVIIVSIVRPSSATSDARVSASVARSAPTLTATTICAPIFLVTSAGMLLRAPPSTSSQFSKFTGVNTPGMAIVARIAWASEPLPRTTASAFLRSVATQRNGVGRSSKVAMSP